MDKLQIISEPVTNELERFNSLFADTLKGQGADFQTMLDFIAGQNGKRIRPLLTLLSAHLCGNLSPLASDFALVLELLHTATLIHDDVVDNTMERRSQPSVNARFDNRVAVLLGDYVLALAISRAVQTRNDEIMAVIAGVARSLAEGELSQLIAARKADPDEDRYFDVIRKKTAVLIAACGEMGAIAAGADAATRERMRRVAENLGLCFQLRDDIFDYFDRGKIGKPTGNDLREGKVSLPLIHALKTAPKKISGEMQTLLNSSLSDGDIARLIAFAKEYGGIEYATGRMQTIRNETLNLLDAFPPCPARNSLTLLANYIIDRDR